MPPRRFWIPALAALPLALAAGCDRTPSWPTQTGWRSYTHPRLGYTIDVPADSHAEEMGESVLFRWHGDPILCVNVVTPQEGRRRGLWAGKTPAGDIELAGRAGKKYVYQHGDGPLWMNVVSYVIPFGGRELGVEFRMHGDELGDVQRHVLESFRVSG